MRDQLGILQAAIQIEALDHLLGPWMQQQNKAIEKITEAIKAIADQSGISVSL